MSQVRTAPVESARVLIVARSSNVIDSLREGLAAEGYSVESASGGSFALEEIRARPFDLVLLSLAMGHPDGLDLLASLRELRPEMPVIVMDADGVPQAVESMKRGAHDLIYGPCETKRVIQAVRGGLESAPAPEILRDGQWRDRAGDLLGRSQSMEELYDGVEKAASHDGHVLIMGERGTGKGLIARLVHGLGPRARRRFLMARCVESARILDPRLFGYHSGFQGAAECAAGLLEEACGGTLLMKEIDRMPTRTQMRLLGMLQDGILRRLGGEVGCAIDIRLMGSTTITERSSLQAIGRGLIHRLGKTILRIPALRERREDIPVLATSILERTCTRLCKPRYRVSSKGLEELMAHEWPGNLTELECVLDQALAVATHREIRPGNLRQFLWKRPRSSQKLTVQHVLHSHIDEVLKRSGGNMMKAAAALGISRSSLYRKLKELKGGHGRGR